MSHTLTREDLLSLEAYAQQRNKFRKNVIETKKAREVGLGEHLRFLFENRQTIQYQVQEMLRIEKIFEADGIQEELDVYNPLIPNGKNLKATMMIEYSDQSERKSALAELIGIERKVYFQVGSHTKVYAICNEDLDRETEEKTSSVHFMRFEFSAQMIRDFCALEAVFLGVEHPNYKHQIQLEPALQSELAKDFD